MTKVLLTGAQSALSYKAKRLLLADEVLLGDYLPVPAMAALQQLPDPASGVYIHEFLKICLALGVERVYPIRRAEALALQHSGALFAEYGIEMALPEAADLMNTPAYLPDLATALLLQDGCLFWKDNAMDSNFLLID